MEAMTLERALSVIDRSISALREAGYPVQAAELSEARVPVARQFAQPAQAVDEKPMLWRVVADRELHDVLNEEERDVVYWDEHDLPTGDDAEGFTIIPLYTRALSGEKAGPVGEVVGDERRHYICICPDCMDARYAEPDGNTSFVAAIQFAITAEQGMDWLRLWNEGNFDACREEWPEAPAECYIGADPSLPASPTPDKERK